MNYTAFEQRNAYLAAKIMTIFLEHPIIFLGYSINDTNIQNILKEIVKCLSPKNLLMLKERLIFVEWVENDKDQDVSTMIKSFDDGKFVNMTSIKLKDYSFLYEALLETKAKINVGVMRRFKEELYDYVITNNPTKHMRVAGIEDERLKDEDLVLAIGNISDFGMKGLKGVTSEELYADILLDDITFSVDDIITEVFPKLLKQNGNSFPVNKFISKSTKEIPSYVYDAVKNNFDDFISHTIRKNRDKKCILHRSVNGIINDYSEDKSLELISYLREVEIIVADLEVFLNRYIAKYPNILDGLYCQNKTNFRRLIRIYDWLKYYPKTKEHQI